MTSALKLTRRTAYTLVELAEPATKNALSDRMKLELKSTIEELSQDAALRAVVLTGSGGAFCAGGDIKAMLHRHMNNEKNTADDVAERMAELHGWLRKLRDLPVPVIVAVDGPAYGAGFGLALTGDLIIASDRATFSASFGKIGAVPDANLMWSLPRVTGLQRARELFYTGRVVDATQALEMGIVMEVHSPDALVPRATEMAGMMSNVSPLAYGLVKEITARSMEQDSDTLLRREAEAQALCLTSPYHFDAIERFAARQKPKFDFD
ncbi:MAG: enoyl-CoA hydratase/isomerase family protein [Pseudomonadota bacterium]